MYKKIKKCLTAFLTAAVAVSAVGCTVGTSTQYVMSIDDYNLNAGVYIYYQNNALNDAKNLAGSDDPNLDLEDTDALEEVTIEGKKFLDWVANKTTANCCEHIAVIRKFDEMGLTLDEADVEAAEDYVASMFDDPEIAKEYKENGIGEESITEVLLNTYKANEIFLAIYGEGGTENVQESTIKENYIATNQRLKYVTINLNDSEGNVLEGEDKQEVETLANKLLATVKNASDEKDMLQKFNEISDEYDTFKAEKEAEALGEEVTTTTAATDEEGSETTTTTVAPYANESIMGIVTTAEGQTEEDLSYNPSKVLHDWAFNEATKYGIPEIIEDENKLYIAVKLDIEERMTEDDLWSENAVDSERFEMYSDALQEKIDEWVAELALSINQDAIDRYEPFDYEVPEETQSNNISY